MAMVHNLSRVGLSRATSPVGAMSATVPPPAVRCPCNHPHWCWPSRIAWSFIGIGSVYLLFMHSLFFYERRQLVTTTLNTATHTLVKNSEGIQTQLTDDSLRVNNDQDRFQREWATLKACLDKPGYHRCPEPVSRARPRR